MRVVQISDIHIDQPDIQPYEIDVRTNFVKCLSEVVGLNPDWIVVTGDLCNRGGISETYSWIKEQLDRCGIPYEVIPGNHDDTRVLMNVFYPDMDQAELYFSRIWEGQEMLFLDTRPAKMSEEQWNWLDEKLSVGPSVRHIFIHHPPSLMAVGYMDKNHAFQEDQRSRFLSLVQKYERRYYIHCGHYHCDKIKLDGNMIISICPTTFFQLKSDPMDFELDHKLPGYKVIDIEGEQVSTRSKYLIN